MWLSEIEDNYILNDTDADSDVCIKNVESESTDKNQFVFNFLYRKCK